MIFTRPFSSNTKWTPFNVAGDAAAEMFTPHDVISGDLAGFRIAEVEGPIRYNGERYSALLDTDRQILYLSDFLGPRQLAYFIFDAGIVAAREQLKRAGG